MQPKSGVEWLAITIFAFLGGIVSNIIVPSRRGALGFVGAAVIGIFTGCSAGFSAYAFGAPLGVILIVSSAAGVCGDRFLTALLKSTTERAMTVNISGGLNNVGDNDLQGNQRNE